MALQSESMLGPYRIAGMIGEGGMGAVYRAKDTRLGRDVAIKVLTAFNINDKERLQRFEQEARATGMLNHPNLLTIYDVGNDEGAPFIVSELLEGETLRERLLRGPLPARRAVDAALQIAHGLAAAHEKSVIHRDLKPDNIFLTRDGRAKILDFGIAKLNTPAGEGAFQGAATEPGMVLGTVGYMSPEQVRGEQVDSRSDIFAFGAILYEMLSGTRAFKRNSSIETLSAILKEEPADLTETLPNIPPALDRLVRRCLEKDRELRFQSARDLAFNLEMLSGMSTQGTLSNTRNPAAPPHTATMRIPPPTGTTAALPTAARPATTARPRMVVQAPRRVSPLLLTLLYIVSIAGAAWGGWYYATRMTEEKPEVAFRRMTFRRGEVRTARFGPDGDTIVYSAAWDGNPSEIFVANRNSPEARPLGLPDADLLAIGKSTEMAILLRRDRLTGLGTLARVPLAGGTPREVADQVLQADWSPDGANLAAIRFANGKYRLESPLGSVRYETPHHIHDMRIAADGRIAFLEPRGDQEDVAVLGPRTHTPVAVARGWAHGANGLAWSRDLKEIWITGTDSGMPPALYAVNVDSGEMRLVSRLTGSMKLFDISAAAHVLLSNGLWRAGLEYQPPGESKPRDVSWLDWSMLADLSRDGRTLLFNETREGGGSRSSIYLRRLDNSAPVRIGDGLGDALSPDGHFVLAHAGAKLAVVPTGSGEAREMKLQGAFDPGAVWVDSQRVVVAGALPQKGYQLLLINTLDETTKPLSPEHIWGEAYRPFAVSPDGRYVAGMTTQQTIALYAVDGGAPPINVPSVQPGEVPIQWSTDAASLYVYRPTALPAQVYRVNLATGARELWKEFTPADPTGVYKIAPICVTPDATSFAYDALRMMNDLYVADGLR